MARTRHGGLEAMAAHAEAAAGLLKLLANAHRLAIVCHLVDGEASVSEINAHVSLSQSALSQHLALLREEGILRARREGLVVYYALDHAPARAVIETLHGIYCAPKAARAQRARPSAAPAIAGRGKANAGRGKALARRANHGA